MGIGSLMNKAIFLDRDGVMNKAVIKNGKPYPPASLSELVLPDDAVTSLQRLKSAGYLLIGITNQPDVARGTTTKETVLSINQALLAKLPLTDIRVCFHDNADQCHCRKPLPGLMLDAAKDYSIDMASSFMIGDRWKDIEAGQRAACKTIWLNYDYQEKQPAIPADFTTKTLTSATDWILQQA